MKICRKSVLLELFIIFMLAEKESLNFAIISIHPFPYGLAATTRIIAYCKGLVECGAKIKIYIPYPTEYLTTQYTKIDDEGEFQGIDYKYTSGRYKARSKLIRYISSITFYRKLRGYINTYLKVKEDSKKRSIDCIIISTDYIPDLFSFGILAKLINAKSIFIFDEYPTPIRHKLKEKIPYWKEFLYKKVLKNITGYISISEALKKYYCNLLKRDTFVLSNIIDISRFEIENRINSCEKPFLCYMGNLELAKDDVDNIIKAFALIHNKYPDLELRLYGKPNEKNLRMLRFLILQLHLTDHVLLLGVVGYEVVPQILNNAKILVSSQPNTIRASGGLPTKLAEYLASGKPTLLTRVGENASYIKEDIHAFFVEPQNPQAYADKLDYILSNYEMALKVGYQGKSFIAENYSTVTKGKEIIKFIKSLN